MRPYRYLLFDLDNTLMDFDRAEKSAFFAAFSACGFTPTDEVYTLYHEINDQLWKQLERGEIERLRLLDYRYELLCCQLGLEDNGCSSLMSRLYFDALREQRFLVEGAESVCAALSGAYSMHIITNGTYEVQRGRFWGSGLEPYFSHVFISEKMKASKPSPLFFEEVLSMVGDENVSHYCVIGDSLSSDIAGANQMGMDAIWLDRTGSGDAGQYRVAHRILDIRELPMYLAQGRKS